MAIPFSRVSMTALVGATITLFGCGPSTPDQDRSGTATAPAAALARADVGSTGAAAGGSITQNFAVTNPDVAKDLPDFVQIPDGSRVQMHMPFSNDRRKGGTLLALTPMPQAEVVAFHRQLMGRNGLIAQPDAVGPKGETILLGRSEDKTSEYNVRVFPPKNGYGTLFSVTYFEPND